MPLHNQCYEVITTLFIRAPRPAGGYYILAEIDPVTVTVSEDYDDGQAHHRVEAIAFGDCALDGVPLRLDGLRSSEHCEIMRPRSAIHGGTATDADRALWSLLTDGLDMQHIREEISSQKENHF